MKSNRKRLAALLAALTLLVWCAAPALALEVVDLGRTGSIKVSLYDTETSEAVSGGELTLYRVANVRKSNANLSFAYTNGFEDCGIELGDLSESDLAAQLEEKIADTAESITETVNEAGVAEFGDLEVGLYLIVQNQAAENYEAINPFLVTVPIQENGTYIYHVDALPKVGTATGKTPETPENPDKPTPETPADSEKPENPENPDTPKEEEDVPEDETTYKPGAPDPNNPNGWVMGAHGDNSEDVDGTGATPPNPLAPGNRVLGAHGLPQTGQLNWPIPVLAAAGVVLVAVGLKLKKGPRKDEK